MDALNFLLVLGMLVAVNAQDYCNVCSDHTMCIYPGVAANCSEPLTRGISDDGKNIIVDTHNRLRNGVALGQEQQGNPGPQPAASNMRKFSWNDEIATIAQRWADQCTFGHDKCRGTENLSVGQNVFILYTPGNVDDPDFASYVQSWYDEVPKFNPSDIDPYKFSGDTGHYTQLAWADTYLVGCGFIGYKDGDWNDYLFVCNYATAGNWIDGSMYEKGDPASQCPDSTSKDGTYEGLCS